MARDIEKFSTGAKRLAALELVHGGEAASWNSWRQETNLFGDHQRTRINLSGLNFHGRTLVGFNLTNVSFHRANLESANLSGTDCAYSDFNECILIGSNLSAANLRFARLSRAYLRDANLERADLRSADLRRASLTNSSLIGADLRGVDLTTTRGLTQEQLDDAVGDSRTRLPSHIQTPVSWAIYERDRISDDEGIENLKIIPASVEVAVVGGVVQLSREPGDAYFASTADPEMLKREIISDVESVSTRCSNVPELSRAITSYAQALNEENYDVVLVGTRGLRLERIFKAITESGADGDPGLLPDAIGVLRAVLIQHFLFVGQSHRWKAFLEEAALAPYTNEAADVAKSTGNKMVEILVEHNAVCQPVVPQALRELAEEIDINDDGQRLSVFNLIASVENVFKSVVTWVVKETKRLTGEIWAVFTSTLTRAIGVGMAGLVSAMLLSPVASELSHKYPDRFAWLHHAIKLFEEAESSKAKESDHH